MATKKKELPVYEMVNLANPAGTIIALVVSNYNKEITYSMRDAAIKALIQNGIPVDNILVDYVPGAFELTLGAHHFISRKEVDAVLALGCVIRGETAHFDYVCQSVTQGITELNLRHLKPVIFGVLTTEDQKQAQERAGGKLGNKGEEAAMAALYMVAMKENM